MGSGKKWVNLSGLGMGQVGSYFSNEYFFLRKKKVFAICKVMQQTLDIKYIILNSPFISRMSSTKQTNTCSIILKLYKFQYY